MLPAHYPIRYIAAKEISASTGAYEVNDMVVDHITPSDGAGTGYTRDQLNPKATARNVEFIHVITGTHSGNYTCLECHSERPFTFKLVLRRREDTP